MHEQSLFQLAFLGQVLLISGYIPYLIARRIRFVFDTYPPETHPRLYPRSLDYYESKRRSYLVANFVIAAIGVASFGGLLYGTWETDLGNTLAFAYFMIQVAPLVWLDISAIKELKSMRNLDTRSLRSAELNPRRLFDVMSPVLFWLVAAVYLAFWGFVAWFRQFDYPWFGGYINNLIITGLNVFFAAILAWKMYGRKANPHQSHEDRLRQTRNVARVLGMVSIAVTLYAVISILLSAEDARGLQPFSKSVYFTIIGFFSMQAYRIDTIDFDVYREDATAT